MATENPLSEETIFTWGAPPLKFGAGAVDEVGFELTAYGVERVLACSPRVRGRRPRTTSPTSSRSPSRTGDARGSD